MIPHWLHIVSLVCVALGGLSTVWITVDLLIEPQHMTIMNVVWPITGLYAGPLGV